MSQPTSDSATAASAPPCAVPAEQADPETWFSREVHPHGAHLKNYLRGAFPSVRDVDDVVQESYLRIWKARALHPIKSAKAFLFTTARHLALDLVRRNKTASVVVSGDLTDLSVSNDEPSVADVLSEQEKISLVGDAIVSLPARVREILILHKFQGQSQSEVARRLGITEKAVEHQVARGLQLCAKFIRARGHEFF